MSIPKFARLLLAGTVVVLAIASAHLRADTHIQPNTGFGVGGSWSTGNKVLYFAYSTQSPVVGYYLNWNNTSWTSVTDCCGGYGTHRRQTTPGSSNSIAWFTDDGNLLLLDGGTVRWETYTGGNYNGFFGLQDDGNLVVRTQGGSPLWSIF